MPSPGSIRTVEERLEKARLLPRIRPEVLNMCKSVDQLLHSQHPSNLSQAVVCVQELARAQLGVVIALKWVVLLVDMLEADSADVRLAACNALAAVCVPQEGRDAVRSAGGLRPLVLLLAEGCRSPVAAAAASALMNCSACDLCKEAIADCNGVTQLLALIRDSVTRCSPNTGGGAAGAAGSSSGLGHGGMSYEGSSGHGGKPELRTPGDSKAAGYAAGALMNMGGLISVQEKMLQAGALSVFQDVCRVAAPGDLVATRAGFVLSWLAVGSGAVDAELQQMLAAAVESGGSRPASRVAGLQTAPQPPGSPGLGGFGGFSPHFSSAGSTTRGHHQQLLPGNSSAASGLGVGPVPPPSPGAGAGGMGVSPRVHHQQQGGGVRQTGSGSRTPAVAATVGKAVPVVGRA